jgi:hypothetical protein
MTLLRDLPPACRPRYDKSLPDYVMFRTRHDVVYHAWYVMDRIDVNFFKEGPLYACRIGNKIYATGWRNLNFSVKEFEDCINSEYFSNS